VMNPEVRETFVKRSKVVQAIRHYLDARNFIEVETPMMHPIVGGAAARPFVTHHNTLDVDLYLRIAPELYLKRLVVGGLDRVYEINRNFRNEGIDRQHNPEFTMLEFYQAYANYRDLMDMTEDLFKSVAMEVNGTTVTTFEGNEIDLAKWQRFTMREAILHFWPEAAGTKPEMCDFADNDKLSVVVRRFNDAKAEHAEFDASAPVGKNIAALFEAVCEKHLTQPTIIYDFPLAVSPLSKNKPDEPDWVERFEVYVAGMELANAFSELNDPVDQLRRFEDQVGQRQKGDEEAMGEIDHDYVRALSYGMPPAGGEGVGIDRLTMVLTGSSSIRDVVLFPQMRPETTANAEEAGEAEGAEEKQKQ
jgi:lysyl-tRNA synthetase, class II